MITEEEYNLSQELHHHEKLIRSVACNKNGVILTGSFEKNCGLFKMNDSGQYDFVKKVNLYESDVFVVKEDCQGRGFFTGGRDTSALFIDNEGMPQGEFLGHVNTIGSISQCKEEPDWFATGAWDGIVKLWDIEKQEAILDCIGPVSPVSVLALPGKKLITTYQDASIKFWDNGKEYFTVFHAHYSAIRTIVLSPDRSRFFTCGNDSCVKEWTLDGQCLNTFKANDGFIFSLCFNTVSNQIFTCGADHTVKVWNNDYTFQKDLLHPNVIYDCAFNPINEDIITACEDGCLRIFALNDSRWMEKNALDDYNSLCIMIKESQEADLMEINQQKQLIKMEQAQLDREEEEARRREWQQHIQKNYGEKDPDMSSEMHAKLMNAMKDVDVYGIMELKRKMLGPHTKEDEELLREKLAVLEQKFSQKDLLEFRQQHYNHMMNQQLINSYQNENNIDVKELKNSMIDLINKIIQDDDSVIGIMHDDYEDNEEDDISFIETCLENYKKEQKLKDREIVKLQLRSKARIPRSRLFIYNKQEDKFYTPFELKEYKPIFYEGDPFFPQGTYDEVYYFGINGKQVQFPYMKDKDLDLQLNILIHREKLHENYAKNLKMMIIQWEDNRFEKKQKAAKKQENCPHNKKNTHQMYHQHMAKNKKYYFPQADYITYDNINIEGPLKKIKEINATLVNTSEYLNEDKIKKIYEIIDIIGNKEQYGMSSFKTEGLFELKSILTTWKDNNLFPFFDCYRMFLLHPQSNFMFLVGGGQDELDICLNKIKSKTNQTLSILAMRIIANHFINDSSRMLIEQRRKDVIDAIGEYIDDDKPQMKICINAILFNYSIIYCAGGDSDATLQIMAMTIEILKNESEIVNIIELFKVIGNLISSNKANRELANEMELTQVIESIRIHLNRETAKYQDDIKELSQTIFELLEK